MTTINRNGHVGRYEDFAPAEVSIDDIVEQSIAARRAQAEGRAPPPPGPREAEKVATIGSIEILRYRLKSQSLRDDAMELGGNDPFGLSGREYTGIMAVFGLIDSMTGRVEGRVTTLVAGSPRAPGLAEVSVRKSGPIGPGTLGNILKELDVPPLRNNGLSYSLARDMDLWHDRETGEWEIRDPVHVVVVTFERTDFTVHPVAKERIDVQVDLEDGYDAELLAGEDDGARERVRSRYLVHAWNGLHELRTDMRPGFSSWMNQGEPRIAKVIEARAYARVLERRAQATRDTAPASPAP